MIKDMILGAALMAGLSAFAVYLVVPLIAQTQSPAAINGCIVLTGAVTMSNLQNSSFICDAQGRLKVTTTP